MKIALRNKYLSTPRYSRYLVATNNDVSRAKQLYNANIRLAQAFHPVLGQFEVILRNSINTILVKHFADTDWVLNQKTKFMSDPSLHVSNYFLRNTVQDAEYTLRRKGINVTSGKIISDLNFGFWVSFFLPHHFSLIGGQSLYAFPHKPPIENRSSIYNKLLNIKNFRNRVSHCEPLCFKGHTIDCTQALEIQTKIYDLIRWIEPELVDFLLKIDNIQSKVSLIRRI